MPPKQHHVLTTEQIETIASPVRRALLEEIMACEEATARELATAIGRTLTAIYPHLVRLEEVGLIEVARRESSGGRKRAVYRPLHDFCVVEYDPKDGAQCEALAQHVGTTMRRTDRELTARYLSGKAITRGARRDTAMLTMEGWLSRDDLKQAHRLYEELTELFRKGSRGRGRRRMAITFAYWPVEVKGAAP